MSYKYIEYGPLTNTEEMGKPGTHIPVVYGSCKVEPILIDMRQVIETKNEFGENYEVTKFFLWYVVGIGELEIINSDIILGQNWAEYIKTEIANDLYDNFQSGIGNTSPFWTAHATPYEGLAHTWVITPNVKSDGTSIPKAKINVRRRISHDWLTFPDVITGVAEPGSNPAAVMFDLLTNHWLGNIDPQDLNMTSFNEAGEYFEEKKIGLSFVMDRRMNIKEMISKVEGWAGCNLTVDNDWNLKLVVPQKNEESSDLDFSMTDDDFISFTISQGTWNSIPTAFHGKFPNNSTGTVVNRAAWDLTRQTRIENIDLTGVADDRVHFAFIKRLTRIAKERSYPFKIIDAVVNLTYLENLPGDVGYVTLDEHNISGKFRILDRRFGGVDDNKITLILKEAVGSFIDDYYANPGTDYKTNNGGGPLYDSENLTFSGGSYTSSAATALWSDQSKVRAAWGPNQEQAGDLVSNVQNATDYDYTFHADGDKITLTSKFQEDVEANSLGLLNVDVWEID